VRSRRNEPAQLISRAVHYEQAQDRSSQRASRRQKPLDERILAHQLRVQAALKQRCRLCKRTRLDHARITKHQFQEKTA